jgi:hypothetical protein
MDKMVLGTLKGSHRMGNGQISLRPILFITFSQILLDGQYLYVS